MAKLEFPKIVIDYSENIGDIIDITRGKKSWHITFDHNDDGTINAMVTKPNGKIIVLSSDNDVILTISRNINAPNKLKITSTTSGIPAFIENGKIKIPSHLANEEDRIIDMTIKPTIEGLDAESEEGSIINE